MRRPEPGRRTGRAEPTGGLLTRVDYFTKEFEQQMLIGCAVTSTLNTGTDAKQLSSNLLVPIKNVICPHGKDTLNCAQLSWRMGK